MAMQQPAQRSGPGPAQHPEIEGTARPPTLLALPSYLAGHVSRIGHAVLVRELSDRGLRLPHFAVLAGLGDFGPIAQHQLAGCLGLNRSHLVGYLDTLEDAGHLTRTRDESDRRRHHVVLTRSGRRLLADLVVLARESETAQLGALTPRELDTLTRLLLKVVRAEKTSPP